MSKLVNILPPTSRTLPDANVGLGCSNCALLQECGGIYEAFDCLTRCCRKPSSCNVACPLSERFGEFVTDAGGWGISSAVVNQNGSTVLPNYIPLLQHQSSRVALLDEPIVALPLSLISALLRSDPTIGSQQIRSIFKLALETKIIAVGVATDRELEGLYRDMQRLAIPSAMAQLGILHITSPNFSFPISLPRTESLVNRSRILKVSEQFSAAGLSVIPHLNATDQSDFRYWGDFLRDRTDIKIIAKEFQTGLKSRKIVQWHMAQISAMQDRIGRRLGLVAIGGRGVLSELTDFDALTVIDSTPFLKAINRQIFHRERPSWRLVETEKNAPIDEHLRINIQRYRADFEEKLARLRTEPALQNVVSQMPDVRKKAVPGLYQLDLWPEMYLPKSA